MRFIFNIRCIVWTGDERVFFYNPSTKTSVWERPAELRNRSDVDKVLRGPPENSEEDGTDTKSNKRKNGDEDESLPAEKKQK